MPRCPDNDEAATFPVNPDVRVHVDTKREDGLDEGAEQKDAEEPGGTESGGTEKAEDDRRTGNPGVPEEAADPEMKEKTGDTLGDRHVPGGAWLTKIRSFLKDTIRIRQENYGRRGEGRGSTERGGKGSGWEGAGK
ncbi:hypothetical protein NDU88_006375 [Pleurodeles waltl]|uniref:Uncharacterized protein n=1 Tax=Pleurodeles waltl TaxID=8319 RepID=A0AAV7ULR3_PLEWA|nr:hypothetical protein NDU88_006375 [Pleurodeles waltl]